MKKIDKNNFKIYSEELDSDEEQQNASYKRKIDEKKKETN